MKNKFLNLCSIGKLSPEEDSGLAAKSVLTPGEPMVQRGKTFKMVGSVQKLPVPEVVHKVVLGRLHLEDHLRSR